jgi:RNA polymerase sigma-70 factor (ECF subfamily)
MRAEDSLVDEATLVRRAVDGSFAAFEQLVSLYEKRIHSFVFQSCHNAADAQEITQDTFVRAFQALDQFNLKYPFGPWLFAIARRKCIDFHRAKGPALEHQLPELADAHDPAFLLSEREDRENLWERARRKLSRVEFDVLWLRYVEDMSVEAIARVIHKTRVHIKVMLFRARRTLGKEIRSDSPAPRIANPNAVGQPGSIISAVKI